MRLVPRRGLELAHNRLILNIVSNARPGLPTKNPTTETTLAGPLSMTPQRSKISQFPVGWNLVGHTRAVAAANPHNGLADVPEGVARGFQKWTVALIDRCCEVSEREA